MQTERIVATHYAALSPHPNKQYNKHYYYTYTNKLTSETMNGWEDSAENHDKESATSLMSLGNKDHKNNCICHGKA